MVCDACRRRPSITHLVETSANSEKHCARQSYHYRLKHRTIANNSLSFEFIAELKPRFPFVLVRNISCDVVNPTTNHCSEVVVNGRIHYHSVLSDEPAVKYLCEPVAGTAGENHIDVLRQMESLQEIIYFNHFIFSVSRLLNGKL